MSASTASLEIDDTLRLAVLDGPEKLSVQLDRERALRLGSALIEFALQTSVPIKQLQNEPSHG
jgi:hypothetical protein